MNRFSTAFFILVVCGLVTGCGSSEPTVIQPTEEYELSEQEQSNRERAEKILAEQRQ